MRNRGRTHALIFLALVVQTAHTWSQGLVIFNNRVGSEVLAPVYDADPANPAFGQQGNGQGYFGAPLAGDGFTAQLFGGPTNLTIDELVALTPATAFRTGDAGGYVLPPSRAVEVPGVPEGQRAKIVLRAWNNRGGSVTQWQQALADPAVARGESLPIITPPLGSVFIAPPNLGGLQSFSLVLPIRLTLPTRRADGQFQFRYLNPTSVTYCVDVSENLVHWTHAGLLPPGSGTFIDTSAANKPRRFYRVVPCSP